ncbi:MAG: hypothetical protein H7Y08_03750 [Rhizobiaceae bacterium]|nr:hypothetical protein [Rhizobiaceae bacterium]
MGKAWINGAQASPGEAASAAARLLAHSRLPLITGLETDVAGVKAALGLAKLCGGVVDHRDSHGLYRAIEVTRSSGRFTATPAEMRRRADRFLIVGTEAAESAADLIGFVLGAVRDLGRPSADGAGRSIVWLGGGSSPLPGAGAAPVDVVACAADGLSDALGMIRAVLGGRPTGDGPISAEAAAAIAATLSGGAFVCVIWSVDSLDTLGIDMAAGLVADLNLATRASSISLTGGGQAYGAAQIATSVTGFPLRSRFVVAESDGGAWSHDAWANDGARLIAAGETDLVVHVSGLEGAAAPLLPAGVDAIVLMGGEMPQGAAVGFEIGVPGRDHAGVLYREEVGSFVPAEADGGGPDGAAKRSAADVLGAIADALRAQRKERAA